MWYHEDNRSNHAPQVHETLLDWLIQKKNPEMNISVKLVTHKLGFSSDNFDSILNLNVQKLIVDVYNFRLVWNRCSKTAGLFSTSKTSFDDATIVFTTLGVNFKTTQVEMCIQKVKFYGNTRLYSGESLRRRKNT